MTWPALWNSDCTNVSTLGARCRSAAGKSSMRVEFYFSLPSATSRATRVAVIALVFEPKWERSAYTLGRPPEWIFPATPTKRFCFCRYLPSRSRESHLLSKELTFARKLGQGHRQGAADIGCLFFFVCKQRTARPSKPDQYYPRKSTRTNRVMNLSICATRRTRKTVSHGHKSRPCMLNTELRVPRAGPNGVELRSN